MSDSSANDSSTEFPQLPATNGTLEDSELEDWEHDEQNLNEAAAHAASVFGRVMHPHSENGNQGGSEPHVPMQRRLSLGAKTMLGTSTAADNKHAEKSKGVTGMMKRRVALANKQVSDSDSENGGSSYDNASGTSDANDDGFVDFPTNREEILELKEKNREARGGRTDEEQNLELAIEANQRKPWMKFIKNRGSHSSDDEHNDMSYSPHRANLIVGNQSTDEQLDMIGFDFENAEYHGSNQPQTESVYSRKTDDTAISELKHAQQALGWCYADVLSEKSEPIKRKKGSKKRSNRNRPSSPLQPYKQKISDSDKSRVSKPSNPTEKSGSVDKSSSTTSPSRKQHPIETPLSSESPQLRSPKTGSLDNSAHNISRSQNEHPSESHSSSGSPSRLSPQTGSLNRSTHSISATPKQQQVTKRISPTMTRMNVISTSNTPDEPIKAVSPSKGAAHGQDDNAQNADIAQAMVIKESPTDRQSDHDSTSEERKELPNNHNLPEVANIPKVSDENLDVKQKERSGRSKSRKHSRGHSRVGDEEGLTDQRRRHRSRGGEGENVGDDSDRRRRRRHRHRHKPEIDEETGLEKHRGRSTGRHRRRSRNDGDDNDKSKDDRRKHRHRSRRREHGSEPTVDIDGRQGKNWDEEKREDDGTDNRAAMTVGMIVSTENDAKFEGTEAVEITTTQGLTKGNQGIAKERSEQGAVIGGEIKEKPPKASENNTQRPKWGLDLMTSWRVSNKENSTATGDNKDASFYGIFDSTEGDIESKGDALQGKQGSARANLLQSIQRKVGPGVWGKRWFIVAICLFILVLIIAIPLSVRDNGNANPQPTTAPTQSLTIATIIPSIYEEVHTVAGTSQNNYGGTAVSLSADGIHVAIGYKQESGSITDSGVVRIFQLIDSAWTQVGATIEGLASGDGFGCSVAISDDGQRLAIGAKDSASGLGETRVFEYVMTSSSWQQLGNTIPGIEGNGQAGTSVSLSGSGQRLAVGAPRSSDDAGYVATYEQSGDSWEQLGETLVGSSPGDFFGFSVSLSQTGDVLAVGSLQASVNGQIKSGKVSVLRLVSVVNAGVWTFVGSDIPGPISGDQFGQSISLSSDGTRVAIGANGHDSTDGLKNVGACRVFSFLESDWTQIGDTLEGKNDREQSGISIALSRDGNRVACGGPNSSVKGEESGVVRVFQLAGESWSQIGTDLHGVENSEFGTSLSLSQDGEYLAVGAPGFRTSGLENVGMAHVFQAY